MLAKVLVLALCVFGLAVGFCIGGVRAEPRGGVRNGRSSTLLGAGRDTSAVAAELRVACM